MWSLPGEPFRGVAQAFGFILFNKLYAIAANSSKPPTSAAQSQGVWGLAEAALAAVSICPVG